MQFEMQLVQATNLVAQAESENVPLSKCEKMATANSFIKNTKIPRHNPVGNRGVLLANRLD